MFPIPGELRKKYEAIKAGEKVLLIGLTGGIASGKSTVARFMGELGGFIIDFDILARRVVRPGEKAWSEIIEYFGEEILLDNREINRKKLSEKVFPDAEKRNKLEGFTHPAIGEEFVRAVDEIAAEENNAIILAVVPLLIECSMQELFHAITLVYLQREKQIIRLIERDGISRDKAINIIESQMPIDDKVKHADFIINNSGTIDETKIQVKDLWGKLREMKKRSSNASWPECNS